MNKQFATRDECLAALKSLEDTLETARVAIVEAKATCDKVAAYQVSRDELDKHEAEERARVKALRY